MRVTATAHEALFGGAPKIVGATEDAGKWRGFELPNGIGILELELKDGIGLIAHPDDPAGTPTVDLALPPSDCLGLLAFSEAAEWSLRTFAQIGRASGRERVCQYV